MLNVTLRQLEYFSSVARTGTISAAAQECHVGAVALGQALVELDKVAGVPLTTRIRSKGVELTDAGEAVLPAVREILKGVAGLPRILAASAETAQTTITIGTINSLSTWLVPRLLEYFENDPRQISFQFIEGEMGELRVRLDRGEIDLILAFRDRQLKNLSVYSIRHLAPYIMAAENHWVASRPQVSLKELSGENFALLEAGPSVQIISNVLHEYGLGTQKRWTSKNIETIKGIVGSGRALALLFSFSQHKHNLEGEGLVSVDVVDPMTDNQAVACIPASADLTPLEAEIIDFLRNLPN